MWRAIGGLALFLSALYHAASPVPVAALADPFASDHVPGAFLVLLRTPTNGPFVRLSDTDTLTYRPLTDSYLLTSSPDTERETYARLLADPRIAYVEPNHRIAGNLAPNDPDYRFENWTKSVNLEPAWDITTGSPDVIIAIVDSGVDANHPDLRGRVLPGYSPLDGTNDTTDLWNIRHGTRIALLAAGRGNDGVGSAGVAWNARILPVRVLGENGRGDTQRAAEGIRWAADHGATIINYSSGSPGFSYVLARQIASARTKNITVVGTAGDTPNRLDYPAAAPDVIVVGSTDKNDAPADFSSAAGRVDLAAPGVGLALFFPDQPGGDTPPSGTSFSAPIVTGIIALMQSVRPGLRQEDALDILKRTARDVGTPGPDAQTGAGIVDAGKALQLLLTMPPVPFPLPSVAPYRTIYDRYDGPVASGAAKRGYIWGPLPGGTTIEPYAEAPGGQRQVWYFDKGRLELTDPRSGQITSGLLVTEMITGDVQTGNATYSHRDPANERVAGDDVPNAVRYSSLIAARVAPPRSTGSTIAEQINPNGTRTATPQFASYAVTTAMLVPETNHAVASVFAQYLTSTAPVQQNGARIEARLFDPTYFVVGLPITDAYWTLTTVGGQQKPVLIQAFERRVLTYTPDNPDGFTVEMGNVGQHYSVWRYRGS